jgi:hypothetical protein
MSPRLAYPVHGSVTDNGVFHRTHLGHRENATALAIKLIRKAVDIERSSANSDPLQAAFIDIAERWAIDHILQGCYVQEYHEWERSVKSYILSQSEHNGLPRNFDWKSGSFVRRTIEAPALFEASIGEKRWTKLTKCEKRSTRSSMIRSSIASLRSTTRKPLRFLKPFGTRSSK